jgi:hypothetical protein
MKYLLLSILFCALLMPAFAQELPEYILKQYPEIAAIEKAQNGEVYTLPTDDYLLIADRQSDWVEGEWRLMDSTTLSYNTYGDQEEGVRLRLNENNWENWYRDLFFYNTNQQLSVQTNQSWVDGAWGQLPNNNQVLYTYDELGNTIEQTSQRWADGDWYTYFKVTTTYYENTTLRATELFQGDNIDNELVNVTLSVYEEYNESGSVLRYTRQDWDEFAMEWGPKLIYERTYDTDNKLILELRSLEQDDELIPQSQLTYTYTEDDGIHEILRQSWNNSTEEWEDIQKTTYGYDDNGYFNLYQVANFDLDLQEFVVFYQVLITNFDHGGDQENIVLFDSGEGLTNELRYTFTYYDDFLALKTTTEEFWDPNINEWVNSSFEEFFYGLFVDTEEQLLEAEQAISLFPNPATGLVSLQMNNPVLTGHGISAQLFNQQGQMVRQYTLGQDNHQMNISGLPVGSYWLKVSNGQQFAVEKLIVK